MRELRLREMNWFAEATTLEIRKVRTWIQAHCDHTQWCFFSLPECPHLWDYVREWATILVLTAYFRKSNMVGRAWSSDFLVLLGHSQLWRAVDEPSCSSQHCYEEYHSMIALIKLSSQPQVSCYKDVLFLEIIINMERWVWTFCF